MKRNIVQGVNKILVLRALVLGDLIFILPALEALRAAYPQAEIVYVGQPWTIDFLKGRLPWVDRVIGIRPAPESYADLGFLIHPEDAAWFFPQMQSEGFDLAFQMQGGGKNSNAFIRRIGARIAIGSREEGAIALDRWNHHDYYQHDVIRNLDLARLAGAEPISYSPCLPVLPADHQAAEPFVQQAGQPFIVLHAGARDIRRCWPPEKFAQVGDYFKREHGLEVVLTGSAVDEETALEVKQAMQTTPLNLSHRLSLPALIGLLAKARLIISNDTGVLHLGLAVGTQAVGLYWGEYISKSMPLARDHFQPQIAWERHCPQCGMFLDQAEVVRADERPCLHLVSFISSITTQQVIQTAEKMLAATTTATSQA